MSEFRESGMSFCFADTEWEVRKYDEHITHKKVSHVLHPTKAVDFLGIHNKNKLYLIEVKNYRGHTADPETKEILKANADELMRRIAIKVRDTIATVTNAARFSTNDQDFFERTYKLLLKHQEKIVIIACIEWDARNEYECKAKMGIWQQKLKQKLAWLHAATISINQATNMNAILPDAEVS